MNCRISIKFLFVLFFPCLLISCNQHHSSDAAPAPVPVPPPNDGNNSGNGNSDAPWALIRLEKHTNLVDISCIRSNVDILIIQEDGRFHLEECHGVRDGRLTVTQRNQIRLQAARILRSDLDRKICAEASPVVAETHLRMILDTGEEVSVYEELTADGLCSYGDRGAALALYHTFLGLLDFYDIKPPVPGPH
jgi:hypothetical protein